MCWNIMSGRTLVYTVVPFGIGKTEFGGEGTGTDGVAAASIKLDDKALREIGEVAQAA